MIQGQEKPKILLLRKRAADSPAPAHADAWAILAKALKTFTEFEEIELPANSPVDPSQYLEKRDHLFLDFELTDWSTLAANPVERVVLVSPETFAWNDPEIRVLRQGALTRHPSLILEGISTSDLVRILHLFLLPKRLAGVAPVMEKGSLIVGEKAMDTYQIGSLLDRLCAHLENLDGLEIKGRIPDLRQVLSAVVLEGLRCAVAANVLYPFVDFQASASKKKLGVNLRFPRGTIRLEQLAHDVLSGEDLFWHQIWQCSDIAFITEHKQHDEIEVMLVLNRPERGSKPRLSTLLFKSVDRSSIRENLLEAPETYQFKLLSDIRLRETSSVLVSSGSDDLELNLDSLPENVAAQIHDLDEKCRTMSESLLRKDSQLQDSIRKCQELNSELSSKRGEALRLMKTLETQSEASEKKIRDLEEKNSALREAAHESHSGKSSPTPAALQETLTRLEAMLRAAESEKTALRESVAHEQKRVSVFEQKYSALYKDNSLKDREINELKSAFHKMRKEQVKIQSPSPGDSPSNASEKMKELESREVALKQEVRKLTFKLENQEKYTKAQQAESSEKLAMLEQKLKEAKSKELELHKKVDELVSALKRLQKAA